MTSLISVVWMSSSMWEMIDRTLSRISSAVAVQLTGWQSLFQFATNSSMALINYLDEARVIFGDFRRVLHDSIPTSHQRRRHRHARHYRAQQPQASSQSMMNPAIRRMATSSRGCCHPDGHSSSTAAAPSGWCKTRWWKQ